MTFVHAERSVLEKELTEARALVSLTARRVPCRDLRIQVAILKEFSELTRTEPIIFAVNDVLLNPLITSSAAHVPHAKVCRLFFLVLGIQAATERQERIDLEISDVGRES